VGYVAGWLFTQRHFPLWPLSGTSVGVIVIIFLVRVFLLVTLRDHYQDSLRTHTIEVMRLSSLIENDIASLESGHRGYLLSANENYIEPFEKKRDLIKQRVDDLTELVLENPRQRKRVIKVQEAVQKWLDTVATPEMSARRRAKGTATKSETNPAGTLAHSNATL